MKERLFRMELEMQEERETWRAEKEEIMRRTEEHMKELSCNGYMMEQKVRDLESKNLQLRDRLSKIEKETQEERVRWRAEKEELMRTAQDFMEAMCGYKVMMEQKVRDLESENLQLRDRLSKMEKEARERCRAEKKETMRTAQDFMEVMCGYKAMMEQKVRDLESERDKRLEKRGDEIKNPIGSKKEQKKEGNEPKKQMKEEKRVRNLEH